MRLIKAWMRRSASNTVGHGSSLIYFVLTVGVPCVCMLFRTSVASSTKLFARARTIVCPQKVRAWILLNTSSSLQSCFQTCTTLIVSPFSTCSMDHTACRRENGTLGDSSGSRSPERCKRCSNSARGGDTRSSRTDKQMKNRMEVNRGMNRTSCSRFSHRPHIIVRCVSCIDHDIQALFNYTLDCANLNASAFLLALIEWIAFERSHDHSTRLFIRRIMRG
jgi:hypothetical protein